MSFYIRLNKSVMTFDGLISAYVCFFKVARETRGRRAWGTALTLREATPGDYWWASLLLRPTDPLLASPLVSSRFFFSSFFFFFKRMPAALVSS